MGRKAKRGREPRADLPARPAIEVDEEIDLHGLTIAEAMAQVEMALARWSRTGGRIRCIHGHSSGNADSIKGALRRNLGSVWKSKVDAFRPEPGNPGTTLIRVRNP